MAWATLQAGEAGAESRGAAWEHLRARFSRPVVEFLRRRVAERRATEELADQFFARLESRVESGAALPESFRAFVAAELSAFVRELYRGEGALRLLKLTPEGAREVRAVQRDGGTPADAELEPDCARSLLLAALRRFREAHPEAHAMLLKLHDRPEGEPPFTDEELAERLRATDEEARRRLEAAREELRRLFEDEVAHTVASEAAREREFAAMKPLAAPLI